VYYETIKMLRPLLTLLFTMLFTSTVSGDSLKESWYIMRGKANMKIKNYGAAIEAYEKAVELNPDNKESMKSLGQAYENQGLTDKAIQQYDRYLTRFKGDAPVAFKLGDYLQWSRYNYRKNDAIKYYRMGLQYQNNKEYRHKLAKLLAGNKSTIDDAVVEYRKLLQDEPGNSAYREEYQKVLLWDDRYLPDAIKEQEELASNNPDNYKINYELAQLYSRDKSRNKDAIRQYEKLLKQQPGNNQLRQQYAKSLAQDPARFNDAKEEYEKVLSSSNNITTREEYADLLAGKASTRRDAQKQYVTVLESNPGNSGARLKYARLLGGSKETLPQAIQQYNIVLKSQPRNGAAHRGLANAYAWMGEKDKAIYHAHMAEKYGDHGVTELKEELMAGREPFAGLSLNYSNQPGTWYGITGLSTTAKGRFDPAYFMTFEGEAGYENYWGGTEELGTVSGFLARAGIEYRPSSLHAISVLYGYHSLVRAGDGNEFMLQYAFNSPVVLFKGGLRRELIYESIASLAGHDAWPNGQSKFLGSARRTRFYAEVFKNSKYLEGRISPYFGWVSAQSVTPNNLAGINADARVSVYIKEINRISAAYIFETDRYERDHSGLQFPPSNIDTLAEPGGYYSPQAFVSHGPRAEYRYDDPGRQQILISTGPSFQYARDKTSDGNGIGFDFHLFFSRRIASNFNGEANIDFTRSTGMAGMYSKFTLGVIGKYLF
jgi:tetratricopeptide (TPR) repeat protein